MPKFYSWGVAASAAANVARICIQSLVIASAAKQSRNPSAVAVWIASSQELLAMTEDRSYPGILTGSDSYPLMKLE
jgi:hypothetical protein